MDTALLNLVNGIPIAAAVLYIWRISDKNHTDEVAKWRETYEKKDHELTQMQKAISDLTAQIQKLTYITEQHVVRNRKTVTRKQSQQS